MPDFARDGYIFNFVDNKPNDWPALVCSQANLLALNNSDLQVEATHGLRFQSDGQISAQGAFSVSTGAAPTERLHITTDGNVGIGKAPDASYRLDVAGALNATSLALNGTPVVSSQWASVQNGLSFTGGNVGIEKAPGADYKLDVDGAVRATNFFKGTDALVSSPWANVSGGINYTGGRVGIDVSSPTQALEVNGAVKATNFFKGADALVSSQWVNVSSGINYAGGNVGIGTTTPGGSLQIAGPQPDLFLVGNTTANQDGLRLHYNETAGTRAGVIDVKGASLRLRGESGPTGNGATERLAIDLTTGHTEISGGLTIHGTFTFPNTSGGSVVLTNATYDNESSFQPNNVKLSLASTGLFILPGAPPLTYEFAIGHAFRGRVINGGILTFRTLFEKKFSINQNGEGYFAGGKGGYVFDYFVNAVGDRLEQGDVVVLHENQQARYSGTNNNIPIPEVDLTTTVYDTRVCGIVAEVVVEQDLPYVQPEAVAVTEPEQPAMVEVKNAPLYAHPLQRFAASANAALDQRKVGDQQMGKMVTLGAYAHCKVDADIAPIQAGDLLTTSPTAGHAQKVLDRSQATGAMIGKALAALDKGKGKIAVLVMLQ